MCVRACVCLKRAGHIHEHTHTRTQMHKNTLTKEDIRTKTHTKAHIQLNTRTHKHERRHTHARTIVSRASRIFPHMRLRLRKWARGVKEKYTYSNTHIHTDAHTHTRTHYHSHTPARRFGMPRPPTLDGRASISISTLEHGGWPVRAGMRI